MTREQPMSSYTLWSFRDLLELRAFFAKKDSTPHKKQELNEKLVVAACQATPIQMNLFLDKIGRSHYPGGVTKLPLLHEDQEKTLQQKIPEMNFVIFAALCLRNKISDRQRHIDLVRAANLLFGNSFDDSEILAQYLHSHPTEVVDFLNQKANTPNVRRLIYLFQDSIKKDNALRQILETVRR